MKENYTNFATSTLASPSPLISTGLLFTVASGQGSLFPTANFVVTIDTEILFISSRSGDTFTVLTRGFNGTAAASHSVGATVQNSVIQYSFDHLWQNVADTQNPDVPPSQSLPTQTPSQWDSEFESQGNWILYPSPPNGSSVFNIGQTVRSCLSFNRGSNDNALYSAYVPFNPPANTAFTITCKLSEGCSMIQNSGNHVETHLFVADQTNPTGSVDSGNRIRIDTRLQPSSSNGIYTSNPYVSIMVHDTNGSATLLNSYLPLNLGQFTYFRLTYDGNGIWRAWAGNGVNYWLFGSTSPTSVKFTPQTLGFQFYVNANNLSHTSTIDWLRVTMP